MNVNGVGPFSVFFFLPLEKDEIKKKIPRADFDQNTIIIIVRRSFQSRQPKGAMVQ